MTRARAIAIGVIAVGLLGVLVARPRKPLEVDVATVEKGDLEVRVSSAASGDVEPAARAVLRAETVARVVSVAVKAGARVEANAELVRFEDKTLAAAASAARVTRDSAERDLATAEAMAKKGIITEQALLQARSARDLARANAQVAEANLARTHVRAPFAGLIARLPVQEGDSVVVGAIVAEVVDDTRLFVRAAFDEVDVVRIDVGQRAIVRLDAYPDLALPAAVERVDPVVGGDTVSGIGSESLPIAGKKDRTVGVRVALEKSEARVLVGMSADVEVVLETRRDVLRVPTAAIFRDEGETFAWVLAKGRLSRRKVSTGEANWETQEILGGLAEGDRVVVSLDTEGVRNGARAEPKKTPPVPRS